MEIYLDIIPPDVSERKIYFSFLIWVETMPAVMPGGGAQGPSCFDRVKIGFLMGACVGMASGALFGGFSALRYGLRGRELIQQVFNTV